MDITQINTALDKFMKQMYDVDVYLTPDKYSRFNEYNINMLIFPSKLLKNSGEFSQKYFNFFNRNIDDVKGDIFKAMKYLGINNLIKVNFGYFGFHLSNDISKYLEDYIKELLYYINEYIEFEYGDLPVLEYVSNVSVDRIEPVLIFVHEDVEPYFSLRLKYDSSTGYDVDTLLNNDSYREPMIDYLDSKMVLDPQIDFWFDNP